MKIWLLLSLIFLSSCKAAKPEMMSLLGSRNYGSISPGALQGNGSEVSGSDSQTYSTPQYKIRSRVSLTPQGTFGATTNYKVRSNVQL